MRPSAVVARIRMKYPANISKQIAEKTHKNHHNANQVYLIIIKFTQFTTIIIIIYYVLWLCSPARAMASLFMRVFDHTQQRATAGRTPLDE
jgi:hypothetical protein